jgi:hypothetical protein
MIRSFDTFCPGEIAFDIGNQAAAGGFDIGNLGRASSSAMMNRK